MKVEGTHRVKPEIAINILSLDAEQSTSSKFLKFQFSSLTGGYKSTPHNHDG